jgi:predicted dehydrogenase
MGNNGVHNMDVIRWGLNKGIPSGVHSQGGRFGYRDQGQTPNTQIATFEYDDGTQILCEIRGLYSNEQTGMHFYGSKGSMHLDPAGNFQVFAGRGKQAELDAHEDDRTNAEETDHFANFVDAIRAADGRLLNCEIEEGERSTALCHLANVSFRLKRELRFDAVARRFISDTEADSMLSRLGRAPFRVPDRI